MGVTRFPYGVEVGDSTTAATFSIGGTSVAYPISHTATSGLKLVMGTVVVPSGASGTSIATGLTSVSYVQATPYGNVTAAGFSGAFGTVGSSGSVTFLGFCGAGTASTSNGTVTWMGLGT